MTVHYVGAGSTRARAILAERGGTCQTSLAVLWRDLVDGRARLVDSFFTQARCYLVLVPRESRGAVLKGRRLQILEALLCGKDCKNIAFDLGLAPSTISMNAKQALLQLGLACTPARVHPMLAIAAQAARDGELSYFWRSSLFSCDGRNLHVVGTARPEALLAPLLPAAQFAVVQGLVEGQQHIEIARRRGTSTRTVANQLAAAFRRIGVSGRGSLIHHLTRSDALIHPARSTLGRA